MNHRSSIRLALVDDDPMGRSALRMMPGVTAHPVADRERAVAVAASRGLSNAEISGEPFMSVPTVKTHVGRLLTTLDVDDRVQLAIEVHDAAR